MKSTFPRSFADLTMDHPERSSANSSPTLRLGVRGSPPRDESPVVHKRRRMNTDTPTSLSPCDSPVQMLRELGAHAFDLSQHFEDFTDSNNSPADSPNTVRKNLKGRYKKDELWAAIASDYNFLMDEEIIDTCKSTESDLSWESDDPMCSKVSYAEFNIQYKELTQWLNHIQMVTQKKSSSRSEKYLNQSYHEEMLQSSPRLKCFNDYAKQLMRRHPMLKDDIALRLQHLNNLWQALEKSIIPQQGYQDEKTMLKDLEQDLNGLQTWINEVENNLLPKCLKVSWGTKELTEKLKEHQILQRDIESHSKVVSAVLKLCERLQNDDRPCGNGAEKDSLRLVATNLERRWHAIWLQSLEWQCRLEEALSKGKGFNRFTDDWNFAYRSPPEKGRLTFNDSVNDSELDHSDGDVFDNGLESDHSNSDVIPFSENEYEKITVDTDCQTDGVDGHLSPDSSGYDGKVSPDSGAEQLRDEISCDSDKGIDSALGRSVSDHSINTEHSSICHSAIKLTTDQVNKAVFKAVRFRSQENLEMRASEELLSSAANNPSGKSRPVAKTAENHDVGYSSESHSNDEPDFGTTNTARDENANQSERETEKEAKSEDLSVENSVFPQDSSSESNQNKDTWRHSMTSAYDTSSNCSDTNSPLEGDCDLNTTPKVMEDNGNQYDSNQDDSLKVGELVSSPNQSFYCMTTIETDSEATSSVRNKNYLENNKSGATTDIETDSEFLGRSPRSLDLSSEEWQELNANGNENVENVVIRPGLRQHDSGYQLSDLEQTYEDVDYTNITYANTLANTRRIPVASPSDDQVVPLNNETPGLENSGLDSGLCSFAEVQRSCDRNRSSSLSAQADSESSNQEAVLSADEQFSDAKELEEQKANTGKASLKRLLNQAESIVKDEGVQIPTNKISRRKKSHSKRRILKASSGDGSSIATDGDSIISSCDASSEFTTSSESESENFSTASSEGDEQVDGSNVMGRHSVSSTLCGSPPFIGTKDLTGNILGHPQRLTDLPDYPPYSISESAIHNLHQNTGESAGQSSSYMRRAVSESSSIPIKRTETPIRRRRRKLKRSASDDVDQDSNQMLSSPGNSSPRSRRKYIHHSTPSNASLHTTVTPSSGSKATSENERQQSDAAEVGQISNTKCNLFGTDRQQTKCPEEITAQIESIIKRYQGASESDTEWGEKHKRLGCYDSQNEDADIKGLLNTTVESIDEVWDNYQVPVYSSISDDANEEKLDGSAFCKDWDQGLEFEEDFHFDSQFGSGLKKNASKAPKSAEKAPRQKRISTNKVPTSRNYHDQQHMEDSDSEFEEFQHVIAESRQQIQVAESTLGKHKKDTMETGIILDPSDYTELLAMCQTNMKCLNDVMETLHSEEDLLPDVTDDDLQQVKDVIERWRMLQDLARERQGQSKDLCMIYQDMLSMENKFSDMEEEFDTDCFDDVSDLESAIKQMQSQKGELCQQGSKLEGVVGNIQDFMEQYPNIKMTKFKEQAATLNQKFHTLSNRSTSRVSELQARLISWYDFNETRKELQYLLSQEQKQLQFLESPEDGIRISKHDLLNTISDLKGMKSEFEFYEDKLESMRRLSIDVLSLSDEDTQLDVQGTVAMLEQELATVRNRCQDVAVNMEKHISTIANGDREYRTKALRMLAEMQAIDKSQIDIESLGAMSLAGQEEKTSLTEAELEKMIQDTYIKPKSTSPLWVKVLKILLPIQLAIVFLFGLLCLLDPSYSETFNKYGLVFNPQLRYVKGPPPT